MSVARSPRCKREHLRLLVGLAGLLGARRGPARALALLPWAFGRWAHGRDLRGHVRDVIELPGWALIDLCEVVVLARHRTLVL